MKRSESRLNKKDPSPITNTNFRIFEIFLLTDAVYYYIIYQ